MEDDNAVSVKRVAVLLNCGVTNPPEERSPLAVGLDWVSRITTISIEMVVPGVIGYWIDTQLETKALFTVIGFGLGMGIGMWQLIRATQDPKRKDGNNKGKLSGEGKE